MWQVKVSHKSEMAGPFNRGDTIINKQFTFYKLKPSSNRSLFKLIISGQALIKLK